MSNKHVSHSKANTAAFFLSYIEHIFLIITNWKHWTLKLLMHTSYIYQRSYTVRFRHTSLCYILILSQVFTLFVCYLAHPNHWMRRMGLKPKMRSLVRQFVRAPKCGLPCRNVMWRWRLLEAGGRPSESAVTIQAEILDRNRKNNCGNVDCDLWSSVTLDKNGLQISPEDVRLGAHCN